MMEPRKSLLFALHLLLYLHFYQCSKLPHPSFTLSLRGTKCTTDNECADREVCRSGQCVDGCSVFTCGVNALCSTTNHVQSCSCVSPWIPWKNENPRAEGCRYQKLRWVDLSSTDPIPENAVTSLKGCPVCRVVGPDGGWHGGWIWIHDVNTCEYEYNWQEYSASRFEVLVDPCSGSGVTWLSGGIYADSVEIGRAVPWPGITYLVCSRKSNGIPGKLFNTRSGLLCHYAYGNRGDRDPDFYSLVKKRCLD